MSTPSTRLYSVNGPMSGLTIVWFALLASLLGGCAEEAPLTDQEVCLAASQHVSECAGLPVANEVTVCDVELARTTLEQNCEQLAVAISSPKADNPLSALACRLGFYSACTPTGCNDDEGLGWLEDDASCEQWQAYEGCAACEYYRCREQYK